ncbi:MAG: peptide-methionine (S)-S-oxide reductase MsrA [Bacteroidota bacterium]
MDKQADISIPSDTAVFGGGCFWCVEAIYAGVKGVLSVTSGYSGGSIENPSYKQVCTGNTGHAEVCQIVYDPTVISFNKLLEIFWSVHDPTTLNRQGNDVGTQYRSVIFYTTIRQRELALIYKAKLNKENTFGKPVVTEIISLKYFYKAEDYHQDYFDNNKDAPYCSYVVAPKVEKFRKVFPDNLK